MICRESLLLLLLIYSSFSSHKTKLPEKTRSKTFISKPCSQTPNPPPPALRNSLKSNKTSKKKIPCKRKNLSQLWKKN
jgi:hypothetical protein